MMIKRMADLRWYGGELAQCSKGLAEAIYRYPGENHLQLEEAGATYVLMAGGSCGAEGRRSRAAKQQRLAL